MRCFRAMRVGLKEPVRLIEMVKSRRSSGWGLFRESMILRKDVGVIVRCVCLCGGLTFSAVPTPAQFTTPPKGARVSFVQLALASTAASISAMIVMSALNLT
jgi:hypothetical protein